MQLAGRKRHALDESCKERHRHAVCVGGWGKLWRVDVCMGIHPHDAEAWARLQCATVRRRTARIRNSGRSNMSAVNSHGYGHTQPGNPGTQQQRRRTLGIR